MKLVFSLGMANRLLLLALWLTLPLAGVAQQRPASTPVAGANAGMPNLGNMPAPAPDEHEYTSEWMYGLHFSTMGGLIGGLDGRYSWRMRDNHYHNIGLQMALIKHTKELRVQSTTNNQTFIPYKLNYFMSIRPDFGHEIVLFRKAQEEGVQLNFILAGGPSIGITKPYYVLYSPDRDPGNPQSIPYNPSLSNEKIMGAGSPFEGLDELKYYLGMHVRPALNFEFGKVRGSGVGLEAGFIFERYFNTIPIMYGTANRSAFIGAYATVFYCKKF